MSSRHLSEKRGVFCQLNRLISSLPTYSSPLAQELPSDGIYFYYEKGEVIRCRDDTLERIVRVGSHRKMGGLPRRLIDHYWANKDGSVFRKHIGCALIRKNEKPEDELRSWIADSQPYDLSIETEVDSYLRTNFKFRTLFVPEMSERDSLESSLVALLSDPEVTGSSETWLGRFSPYSEIRSSGLWNVRYIGGQLENTPAALLARIKELVDLTIKNCEAARFPSSRWQWEYINQAIRKIREDRTKQWLRIRSFELLFQDTGDGWVALHLARELRAARNFERALEFAALADKLLPLPSRKAEAIEEIRQIKASLESERTQEPQLLVVVGCSPEKIWDVQPDAEQYVPAKEAYVGEYFKKWLHRDMHHSNLSQKSWRWIILSGKYGFIEPDHPICNYDVNLVNPSYGPISKESLKGQSYKQSRWTDRLRLCDFKEIVVHASERYLEVVREIFRDKPVRSWKEFASSEV